MKIGHAELKSHNSPTALTIEKLYVQRFAITCEKFGCKSPMKLSELEIKNLFLISVTWVG